jgi:hypothetical protein
VTAAQALAALLAVLPARRPYAACLTARAASVTTDADAASSEHGVPVALLLAVGYAESHLGCARGSGGCWGAPVSRLHRHTAGRASHAASALALGHRRCGTWTGALAHFRCGRCVCQGGYVARVGGLWSRVERRAEVSR